MRLAADAAGEQSTQGRARQERAAWGEDQELSRGAVNFTCDPGHGAPREPPEGSGIRKEIKGSFKWSGTRQLKMMIFISEKGALGYIEFFEVTEHGWWREYFCCIPRSGLAAPLIEPGSNFPKPPIYSAQKIGLWSTVCPLN